MRTTLSFPVVLLASSLIAACTPAAPPPPPPPDTAAVKSAIEAANAKIIEAAKKGDAAGMAANYDANAKVLPPGEQGASGTAGITQAFTGMTSAMAIKEFTLKVDDVVVTGNDYAVETGTYSMLVTPKGGKDMADQGKYVVVWKKQADGSWKLFRDIWNSTPAAKPAAPAKKA